MSRHRSALLFTALLGLAPLSILLSLSVGSVDIPFGKILELLGASDSGLEAQVLWELRVPRSLAAFITGGLLALAGVIMQVLLRNPLADPYILGISGGAAVAALSVMLLGLSGIWVSNAAFVGALASIFIVFGLAGRGRGGWKSNWSSTRLLLTGVVISAGWGALINLLLTTSSTNTVHSMLFWLMGDLSQSRAGTGGVLVLAVGIFIALAVARSLNVLARGELTAASLGVNVSRLKILLYFSASILTASAVTIAGSIGFVGLVIPHMLRLTGARDHRLLIPCSVLLGGSFLVIADSFARTIIAPQQLPVGVVTAIIGVPAFLIILRHSRLQST